MEVAAPNYVFDIGPLPSDWRIVPLGEVGRWYSGGTPSMKNPAYWQGDIPWVSPKDMKVSRLRDSVDHISNLAVSEGARLMPSGTILMVIRGMILAHSFPVARAELPVAFNQDMKGLVVHDGYASNYVLYWLIGHAQKLRGLTTESTHGTKRLPPETLYRVPFPLPPTLAEQEAIAGALSDADALIESLEQLVAKKRQIKHGAMQQLLTGQKRLPGFSGEWETKRLGELGTFLKGSGVTKSQTFSGDLPCVRYGEIYTRHNDYVTTYFSWISREVAQTATRLRRGDILFAGSGETKEEIGKCVAFIHDIEAYAGGDIVILRTGKADPLFLGFYLNTSEIARQKASLGQGDAVVHISASALATIQGRFPKLEEQQAIAAILSDMDVEIAALEAKLAKARQVKQGMMQELLTGRIRLMEK
ncbi:restriction endonuclease subunit S [Chloracidobacterium validum]|uniref:Restriction endonuclease subunit S n=1 Tax=Chloracidobacterium validum TaxID=2821543 RepID=A0ABX8B5S6_9BACT|nr:restriction endonuclease subunit S [Chloracidobacterium validum]QUW02318.1 restriction endonuclease subunit S [Chloracidobacterium validum]